ncbi:uncharacterized protein LOC112639047 [Camponotus floridanus]|uniref:uncharacterized protein LOC112639047 n=1 Tax=Camponotus floridanus TaxID=104421 RepID=UPI000DC68F5D|nr:uncharacterized protein LOC112639047 [Camponotus floridanus]
MSSTLTGDSAGDGGCGNICSLLRRRRTVYDGLVRSTGDGGGGGGGGCVILISRTEQGFISIGSVSSTELCPEESGLLRPRYRGCQGESSSNDDDDYDDNDGDITLSDASGIWRSPSSLLDSSSVRMTMTVVHSGGGGMSWVVAPSERDLVSEAWSGKLVLKVLKSSIGFDESISTDEIVWVTAQEGDCLPEDVKVNSTRVTKSGLRIAWIKCPIESAVKISKKGKIKVGHQAKTCGNKPCCIICAELKMDSNHRIGSSMCKGVTVRKSVTNTNIKETTNNTNLNHCRGAHDLHNIKSLKIGISIIAEPYLIPDDYTWASSIDGKAAIHWSREHLHNAGIIKRSGRHSVTVQWPSFCVTACYISPNCTNEDYDELIDELGEVTNDDNVNHIIGRDFNSKAYLWGSNSTDHRGELLIRWAASKGVNLLNKRKESTCIRPQVSSVVDLTWVSDRLHPRIQNWHIMDECTLSDHVYISFNLNKSTSTNNIVKKKYIKWAVKKLVEDMYNEVMEWLCTGEINLNADNAANWLNDTITDACEAAMPHIKPHHKSSMYWWSDDIALACHTCNRERRKWQKGKRKKSIEELIILEDRYREAKKKVNFDDKKSKDKGMGGPHPGFKSGPLGPPIPSNWKEGSEETHGVWSGNDSINESEILGILRKAKTNKAPGIDGIKAILLRKIPKIMLKKMTEVFNICLEAGVFPDIRKKALLVLIPKGTLDMRAPKVRPICLLSELGKVFEKVIVGRLNAWMDSHPESQLSSRQYGFRKQTSTCDALSQVQHFITEALNSREVAVGISLDIHNAFNSIRWKEIRKAIIEKGFPHYICKIINS